MQDDNDGRKRYQPAERLADLFDQYQVYRADWLAAWADGRDVMIHGRRGEQPLEEAVRWQPALWRVLLGDVGEQELAGSRAGVHPRFVEYLRTCERRPRTASACGGVRHFLVAGTDPGSAVGHGSVQSGAAVRAQSLPAPLGRHSAGSGSAAPPVPPALPQGRPGPGAGGVRWSRINMPIRCWRPGASRAGTTSTCSTVWTTPTVTVPVLTPSAAVSICLMTATPSIYWVSCRMTFSTPAAGGKSRIRLPLAPEQLSVEFHVGHSPQREVEILHDRLLARFSEDDSLRPRDIIVMVPDINVYAPIFRRCLASMNGTTIALFPLPWRIRAAGAMSRC
ncbi:exodeoxyribonuclease V subunit gamma [Oceanimonas sp. NS1]|nr:exodeoxyribonuclease V subunit gamma [Oceanimonas sp. NS1]